MPLNKNIRQHKNEIRAVYRRIRANCPKDVKRELDIKITKKFLSLEEYRKSKTLFAFVSTPIEVDTSLIIETALKDGKRLAVPKCRDKSGLMDFYYITSVSCLKKGAFSIMEPDEALCEKVSDYSDGLCIVPGLCFDFQGYRLGFGKGYYDRFLERFGGTSVGICYSRCIEKELPKGIFDKNTDILVTDKFINYIHNVSERNDKYEP